jgi:hypothetical protein
VSDYVPPKRYVVDDETFDRLTEAIENPRPPTPELIELFRKHRREPQPGIPGNKCECGWDAGPYWCSNCGVT